MSKRTNAKNRITCVYYYSFCNISYCSNSEYWSQKPTQSGNIYSTILDVYDGQQRVSSRELKTFLLSKTLTKWLEFLMASEIQKNSSGFELQVQILNVWYSDRYCNCFKIHRYTRTRSRLIWKQLAKGKLFPYVVPYFFL